MLYKVNKKNGKTIYTPFFPSKLAKMDGMKVELQGYMVRSGQVSDITGSYCPFYLFYNVCFVGKMEFHRW